MSTTTPIPDSTPSWLVRSLARPSTYVLMGLGILGLDVLTGPFLLFPIFFVLPVSLCGWFYSTRWAYSLATLLPLGRCFIALNVDTLSPPSYSAANALIRIAVLVFLAYLVGRTARQTKALQERIIGLVTVCAWSRTIEYQGEWISFEKYLKRRFNLDTSHGMSPAEAQKAFDELKTNDRNA